MTTKVQWNIAFRRTTTSTSIPPAAGIDLADIGGTADAHTSGGGIKTGRLAGNSTLKTSGGSIRVDGASGRAGGQHLRRLHRDRRYDRKGSKQKTSGGSITLGRVGGSVVARTSGGGIRVEDAMGSVDASTSGGSITARISRQPQGDSRLSTSGGSVTVSLAGSMNLDLDAQASGGGVNADVPVTVQGSQNENTVRGRIGTGGPKLVLRSSGGRHPRPQFVEGFAEGVRRLQCAASENPVIQSEADGRA